MAAAEIVKIRINVIAKILDRSYPVTKLYNRSNPLEEALFIILTSQTDERKYLSSWKSFRKRYPRISDAANADEDQIAKSIQKGGLSKWKAKRIMNLLKEVKRRYGRYSLSSLKVLDNHLVEKELRSLDGIGIKNARCIMMYSLGRDVFPLDTHCERVLKRIGISCIRYSKRSKAYADCIQAAIPERYRYRLHINLIQHGRNSCTARPQCDECCINKYCSYYSA